MNYYVRTIVTLYVIEQVMHETYLIMSYMLYMS